MKKKRHHHPALLILGLSLVSATAQDANPFVKKPGAKESAPPPPAGAAVHRLVEYIALPSAVLDQWEDTDGDAAKLRAALQPLIDGGKATPIHTLFGSGTRERAIRVDTIAEQIYPTEFMPSPPNGWPYPTAFETRNMGISANSFSGASADNSFNLESEWVVLADVLFYHELARRTSQPGDMFLPNFRTHTLNWKPEGYHPDPFADPPGMATRRGTLLSSPTFAPGKVHLVSRTEFPGRTDGTTVAVFFRGDVQPEAPAAAPAKGPDEYRISVRLVKIPQRKFSAWIQSQPTGGIAATAWDGLGISGGENITTVTELAGTSRKGERTGINQWEEYIYPTEYMPYGFRNRNEPISPQPEDAKAEIQSTATAYETRNVGMTAEVRLTDDARGLLLNAQFHHVTKLGDTVCRRFRDGNEWRPDMTMPLFSTYSYESTIRPQRGKWMLASTGSTFTAQGQPDPQETILTFIRID
ncbi:hypothetical protein OVA24_08685 [Luteolibacter sp. SL250]|uniref:hypothetical protein n=1 Tax=Luteolibacter sp. SL250 TaxID=2995170 RepID=UPI00226D7AA3|nr:hypothetical protein [Luteolibacter sp. SL250]WAC21461.1 hypothetical protein OVA24_08685 [Luteolibacter sp. SL250]